MALNFLNNIDLNKNQVQNGVIHVLAAAPLNPVEGQIYYNSTDKRLYFYDATNWIDASGDIKSVTTTTGSQITITDPTGPNPSIAIVTAAVTAGGTALATGDQIATYVTNGIGNISFTVQGTTNEIEVTNGTVGDGDTVTIGLPNDVTISNDLTVTNDLDVDGNVTLGTTTANTVNIAGSTVIGGDLTVQGTTTSVNSNTVNIGDSIITLNSDETGTPSQDGGIEIERGTAANRSLLWDESAQEWTIQQASGNYERIATYADSVEDVTVQEGAGGGVTVTQTLSGTDNRIKTYDLELDITNFTYKASIGDGASLSYDVTHNFGTRDVIVQLYDTSSYDTVYADVVRTDTTKVTITFATAPTTNDIRVLIQKL